MEMLAFESEMPPAQASVLITGRPAAGTVEDAVEPRPLAEVPRPL